MQKHLLQASYTGQSSHIRGADGGLGNQRLLGRAPGSHWVPQVLQACHQPLLQAELEHHRLQSSLLPPDQCDTPRSSHTSLYKISHNVAKLKQNCGSCGRQVLLITDLELDNDIIFHYRSILGLSPSSQ